MLTSIDIIRLYLVLNKLMYKHAEIGRELFNSPYRVRLDSAKFKEMEEMSLLIYSLLDANDPIVRDGLSYPFFSGISSDEFNQLADAITYKYELDPLPNLEFPKNTTKYINSQVAINTTVDGTVLPEGGGPGLFLTKTASGEIAWRQVNEFISDFNLL